MFYQAQFRAFLWQQDAPVVLHPHPRFWLLPQRFPRLYTLAAAHLQELQGRLVCHHATTSALDEGPADTQANAEEVAKVTDGDTDGDTLWTIDVVLRFVFYLVRVLQILL